MPEEAGQVAETILKLLVKPFTVAEKQINTSASIGIAVYSGGNESVMELNKAANTAMYDAKQQGRNNYQFFSEDLQQKSSERRRLWRDLGHALNKNEMDIFYQPQIATASGQLSGFEALLRWQHGKFGAISPVTFIPLAEESRLINTIGEWVLSTACTYHAGWQKNNPQAPPLSIAVNVSTRQLKQKHFCKSVEKILESTGLPPQNFEIELTESIILDDPQNTIQRLTRLHHIGVRIALDDFGTGYSSLSYLRKLPIDTVKIDISFTRGIGVHSDSEAIIKAIISLSHDLGLEVVAEGVETAEQIRFLRTEKCDYLQGFYFSKPVDASATETLLKEQAHWNLEELS
jgi:EAL domain-containing protein (putative c-di-GMP-specific phosphodiesterase class I)